MLAVYLSPVYIIVNICLMFLLSVRQTGCQAAGERNYGTKNGCFADGGA